MSQQVTENKYYCSRCGLEIAYCNSVRVSFCCDVSFTLTGGHSMSKSQDVRYELCTDCLSLLELNFKQFLNFAEK